MTSATKQNFSHPAKLNKIEFDFEAIGTAWHIEVEMNPEQQAVPLSRIIADRISLFDSNYSRFRPDSWVSIIRKPGHYKTPDDFADLYNFYKKLYFATNGLVTPLIGDALERAGYDANYSLKPKSLKPIPQLHQALDFSNDTLHVKCHTVLDFGAAGKGYLVDLISQLLKQKGITNHLIDAGGDILVASPTPSSRITIGLEDPRSPNTIIGTAKLNNQSLGASAGNRRQWHGYHHLINPHSLQSATGVQATWAIAPTAMQADGLATALFFSSPERLLKEFDFEYMIMLSDNSFQASPGFPGRATNKIL